MPSPSSQTRECALDELNPELKAALRNHIAQYQLGDLEAAILMCCESSSTRRKKGVFGGTENLLSAIFVTPTWLVWAESDEKGTTSVESAQLRNIDVRDFATTAMFAIRPELGLNLTGRYTDNRQTGIAFIPLDSGEAGKKFRRVLEQAMQNERSR